MKILLVDDSHTMRKIQRNRLIDLGYIEIVESEDGYEALSALEQNPDIQLILLDWNMPRMNGLETLKAIKANPVWRSIPVIMVTSEGERSKIMEALSAGAVNYMTKPFDPAQLVMKIKAILHRAKAQNPTN